MRLLLRRERQLRLPRLRSVLRSDPASSDNSSFEGVGVGEAGNGAAGGRSSISADNSASLLAEAESCVCVGAVVSSSSMSIGCSPASTSAEICGTGSGSGSGSRGGDAGGTSGSIGFSIGIGLGGARCLAGAGGGSGGVGVDVGVGVGVGVAALFNCCCFLSSNLSSALVVRPVAAFRCAISCSRFGCVFLGDSARDLRLEDDVVVAVGVAVVGVFGVINVAGGGFSGLLLALTGAAIGVGEGGRDLELRVARLEISGGVCLTTSSNEDLRRCDADFGVTCGVVVVVSGGCFCGVLFGDLFVEFCRVRLANGAGAGGGLSNDLRGERFGTLEVETVAEVLGVVVVAVAAGALEAAGSLRFSGTSLSLPESEPLPLLELLLLLLLEELLLLSLSPELELERFGGAIRRLTGVGATVAAGIATSSLERRRGVPPTSEARRTGVDCCCCLLVVGVAAADDLLEGVDVVVAAAEAAVVAVAASSFSEVDSCEDFTNAAPLLFSCSAAFFAACRWGT